MENPIFACGYLSYLKRKQRTPKYVLVTAFEVDGMVRSIKHGISQERNVTFPINKKCVNWVSKAIFQKLFFFSGGNLL